MTEESREWNLRHWNALFRTDPNFAKPFQTAGGFRGTATAPIFSYLKLTEHFGPIGVGWGFNKPEFQIVDAEDKDFLVFCTVECWYLDDDLSDKISIWGVGGDRIVKKDSRGISPNDEAFKAALTDAIGNAFYRLGQGADIRLGLWNDVKYLAESKEYYKNKPSSLGAAIEALEKK